jgi:hypothetical protein
LVMVPPNQMILHLNDTWLLFYKGNIIQLTESQSCHFRLQPNLVAGMPPICLGSCTKRG